MYVHREPRFLALQKFLHHDNKKDSLTLAYFVASYAAVISVAPSLSPH